MFRTLLWYLTTSWGDTLYHKVLTFCPLMVIYVSCLNNHISCPTVACTFMANKFIQLDILRKFSLVHSYQRKIYRWRGYTLLIIPTCLQTFTNKAQNCQRVWQQEIILYICVTASIQLLLISFPVTTQIPWVSIFIINKEAISSAMNYLFLAVS